MDVAFLILFLCFVVRYIFYALLVLPFSCKILFLVINYLLFLSVIYLIMN